METFDCVLALAEFKNMTRAAEHLFLSQPALTLRIQRLEQDLGFRIFDRSTRPISITSKGRVYLQEMRRIKNEEEKLKYMLREIADADKVIVRIGIGFNRGRCWLPRLLPLLAEQDSQIDYQFHEATDRNIEKMLRDQELDFGITGSFTLTEELTSLELGQEDIYIGVPANNPILENAGDLTQYSIRNPYIIPIRALEGQTLILGQDSYGLTRYCNHLFSIFHISPGKIISIGNGETRYLLAAAGIGITFLFSSYPTEPSPDVFSPPVPCALQDIPLRRTAFLLCSSHSQQLAHTERLFSLLQSLFFSEITENSEK